MNFAQLRRSLTYGMVSIALASSVLLASCGGSGGGGSSQSAGVGGTGIAAGKTTGFGSIYVNGRKFNTDTSQFIVDGDTNGTQSQLAVGMYVKLRVKTLDGNFTGEALEVVYDDEVQGPVAGLAALVGGETQRNFTVFGQNVTIDDTGTLFQTDPANNPGFGFDTISNNDVVEISGFRTSDSDITATYVEWKEFLIVGSELELRGTISGYVPPTQEFMLDGVLIRFDNMTEIEVPNGMLQDGLFVEVEGTYQTSPVRVDADEIEEEDEEFGDDIDDISLHGVISNYNQMTGEFEINGLPIDTSQATELSPANVLDLLDDGVEIEVEGDIEGGVFIADEVELRDGESELRTTIRTRDVNTGRIELEYPGFGDNSLGTVWVNVDGQTLFEDESAANVPNLTLDLLVPGDFVKIKGIANTGEVSAEIVKRLDPDSSKLKGTVEAFDPNPFPDTSITILGIAYPVDPAATYEDENGLPMNATDFFNAMVDSSIVELEDDDPADGDVDELEFDD